MIPRRSLLAIACAALFGCSSTSVHMVSPVARYDHNRTRPLCIVTTDEPAPCVLPGDSASAGAPPALAPTFRFRAESYAPQGTTPYHAQYARAEQTADSLPPAQLVPIFTGLPLPLSSAKVAGCESCASDRDDLTDFLASGPGVLAGVDVPDTQGDVTATQRRAAPVLDRLAQPSIVTLDRAALEALLAPLEVEWADVVVDNRYPPAAVVETAAFLWQGFWFVLYRFPNGRGFTRLVVVPTQLEQDLLKKRPTADLTPEEKRVRKH